MPKALTPLTCDYPECFKIFGRKGDLTRHKNIHLGRKPFECEYCHKKFAQFSGLKTHENVHNGNKPHVCGYDGCTAIFGDPSSCARHRKETHRRVGAYCCPEPYCSSRIKRRSAFAAHLKKHGIDSKNLDLESFAPPLLPESQKSTGRITRIESGSYERLPTLAEEFEDQFCGFTDEASPEETPIYRPSTSMSWSTSSDYSPSLSEVSLEPSTGFAGLLIADVVQPTGLPNFDYCSQYSSPYASTATTPYNEYGKMNTLEDTPSLGLYTDSGLCGFPGQDFSTSFPTSYFPFNTARIVSPELPLFEFPAMAWVEG